MIRSCGAVDEDEDVLAALRVLDRLREALLRSLEDLADPLLLFGEVHRVEVPRDREDLRLVLDERAADLVERPVVSMARAPVSMRGRRLYHEPGPADESGPPVQQPGNGLAIPCLRVRRLRPRSPPVPARRSPRMLEGLRERRGRRG